MTTILDLQADIAHLREKYGEDAMAQSSYFQGLLDELAQLEKGAQPAAADEDMYVTGTANRSTG